PLLGLPRSASSFRKLPRVHTSPRRLSTSVLPHGVGIVMQTVPLIPDNAPFTPEQRSWLNGFLAGIYSSAAVAPAVEPPRSLKVGVLDGSQSGTAGGPARRLAKELKSRGHVASLISLEVSPPAALLAERHAVIITSTYGDGEPPESARSFYEELCLQHFPCCE